MSTVDKQERCDELEHKWSQGDRDALEQTLADLPSVERAEALGVMLYQSITGELPHDRSGSCREVLRRQLETPPRSPRDFGKPVELELETLLLASLSKDAELRPSSAGDLGDAIADYREMVAGRTLLTPIILFVGAFVIAAVVLIPLACSKILGS